MKDYASESAERWYKRIDQDLDLSDIIEGAIREALAKAAARIEPAHEKCQHEGCAALRLARQSIRALGAKP